MARRQQRDSSAQLQRRRHRPFDAITNIGHQTRDDLDGLFGIDDKSTDFR
jgi:hypothetical protein